MKTILFVCVANSCRSQIAEAFFNHYAPEGFRAESAGTAPSDMVNSTAKTVMLELGIDLGGHRPIKLTDEMIKKCNRIISMGCSSYLCPSTAKRKFEDWGIPDPVGKDINFFREIREVIQKKVLALVEKYKADNKPDK
jgi:arsenate reductase (thioredoxin)